jgi:hypothetical protein
LFPQSSLFYASFTGAIGASWKAGTLTGIFREAARKFPFVNAGGRLWAANDEDGKRLKNMRITGARKLMPKY